MSLTWTGVKSAMSSAALFLSTSVEGLHAIVVTDRDGVPVIKGRSPSQLFFVLN